MTEDDYKAQKAHCRKGIAVQQNIIQAAHKKIVFYEDWLIDLLDAAQQEPWFGEAND